jgi:hypothetical protein
MILSAFATREMSSSLLDGWHSNGGPDSRTGPGQHECEARRRAPGLRQTLEQPLPQAGRASVLRRATRGWRIGVEHFTRRKRPHRAWRERKAHAGELLQLDGSHHDWFEGRGPRCVLMAYIDDASSRVFAHFYAYEGTIPAMDSFTRYVQHYGIPLAVYADKHTTYQSPAPPTMAEPLAGGSSRVSVDGRWASWGSS